MAALVKAAGETAARAKAIARALYPADIDANGLLPALERLVQAAAERTGSRVELQASPDFGIHEAERAIHVYRIVQEALNNAVRHSKASVITVRLAWEEGSMVAEVRDNGIGFEAAEAGADNEGMGIKILKYRASVLGAQLRISRAEGGGTLVSCRLEG
jgi:signal transduction histidine kinase